MRKPALRRALYGALALLFLLHNDPWLQDEGRLVLGLPAGLAYHVAFCFAAAAVLGLLVRWAWPAGLDAPEAGVGNGIGRGEPPR